VHYVQVAGTPNAQSLMLILKQLKLLDTKSIKSKTVWKAVEEKVLSTIRISENDSNKFGFVSTEKLTREQNKSTASRLGISPPSLLTDAETEPPSEDCFPPPNTPPAPPPPPPPPQIQKPKGAVM